MSVLYIVCLSLASLSVTFSYPRYVSIPLEDMEALVPSFSLVQNPPPRRRVYRSADLQMYGSGEPMMTYEPEDVHRRVSRSADEQPGMYEQEEQQSRMENEQVRRVYRAPRQYEEEDGNHGNYGNGYHAEQEEYVQPSQQWLEGAGSDRVERGDDGPHGPTVDYGAYTGGKGAFGWYADFPVKSHHRR